MQFKMKSLAVALWSFLAAIAGAFGNVALAGYLDKAYRPFSSDMPAWIFHAFPTGALLGGISAYAVLSHRNRNYLAPGVTCIVAAMVFDICYLLMFFHTLNLYDFKYAASESGPALIWSSLLFVYGVFLVFRNALKRT